MDTNSEKTKSYFNRRAKNFDALYEASGYSKNFVNKVLRKGLFERIYLTLEETRGMRDFTVLDIGCGPGRNSALFAERGASKVIGIDYSQKMVELAKKLSREKNVSDRCEFIKEDFLAYSPKEKFDIVVALGVFDYIANPAAFLSKMRALTRVKMIASFPRVSLVRMPIRKIRYAIRRCPLYFYSHKQLNGICKELGFKDFHIIPYSSSGMLLVAGANKT